jgi:crossover junction endodeoxyribonuclease RuvC
MVYYAGLDLSLTCSGVVIVDSFSKMVVERAIKTNPDDFDSDIQRCDYIAREIVREFDAIGMKNIKLIILEDYFSGYKNPQVGLRLATLGTIVRLRLLDNGYNYLTITPAHNKKFVSGNGQAKKDKMQMYIYKKYGIESITNDTADACGMAFFAKGYCEYKEDLSDNKKSKKKLTDEEIVIKKVKQERNITYPYKIDYIAKKIEDKKNNKKKTIKGK